MAVRYSGTVLKQLGALFSVGTATGLDDSQLIERFLARHDEAAFEALVARHGPLVLGVCRRLMTDPADVEDAFQATFLVLVRKASSLRDRRHLSSWIYKVAYRVALRARVKQQPKTLPEPSAAVLEPSETLERNELRTVIDEEIQRLPERFRRAVVLCDLEGLTHEEAARRLGCPPGTINSRLATARLRLRDRLTRRGLAPSAGAIGPFAIPGELTKTMAPAVADGLLHATVRTALASAAGSAVSDGLIVIPAAAAALAQGVLRTMFLTKLKIVAAGIMVTGLVMGGAVVFKHTAVQAQPAKESGPLTQTAPRGRASDGDSKEWLAANLKERLELAGQIRDAKYLNLPSGGNSFEEFYFWESRYNEIVLEGVEQAGIDSVVMLQAGVERAQKALAILSQQQKVGLATQFELVPARLLVLEAKARLARAKATTKK